MHRGCCLQGPKHSSQTSWGLKKTAFLRLEAGRMLPRLAGVPRHKDAVLLVASKERALPDIHSRSLHLPTRADIHADEQAVSASQIVRFMKQDGNSGLRIGGRNFRPG